jgi:hypothetical protein
MAHTYLLFDFGTDEEKAQQARHKLEGWKQAFRLDKKLLYKLDRAESEPKSAGEDAAKTEKSEVPPRAAKSKSKPAAKSKQKTAESVPAAGESPAQASNGKVHLLIRLYFSGHEKLTEQRWLDRIPTEEPFKAASPRVVRQGEPEFDEVVKQFDSLE